jgi:hypothetical protein
MPKDTTAKVATATKRARRTVKPTARKRSAAAAPPAVTHADIALRAYELHLSGTEGDATAHWLRAERELVGA